MPFVFNIKKGTKPMERIDELIEKHVAKTLNGEEQEELIALLKESSQNRQRFKERVKTDYLIDFWRQNKTDSDQALSKLHKKLFKVPVYVMFYKKFMKYAAILIVLIGTSYGVWQLFNETTLHAELPPVLLKSSDGSTKALYSDAQNILEDAHGNTLGRHQYDEVDFTGTTNSEESTTTYNELIVPPGKRFKVILSDSTKVYLNSETIFKFPASFSSQSDRSVFVEGEAYFEVYSDKEKPFIVHTTEMIAEVLGTTFNMRAYPIDGTVKTSLVEGSVLVRSNKLPDNNNILSPGEAAFFTLQTQHMDIEETYLANDIAWINNRLLFVDEPFSDIIKKIERSYGVTIKNNNPDLNAVHFFGDFDLEEENVEDVLKAFKAIQFFEYDINQNIITIKKLKPMK